MNKITPQQFLLHQPSYPTPQPTDPYYHELANKILEAIVKENLLTSYPAQALQRLVICIIGYYQDIISDAGLWRGFINEHKRLYNKYLPFFELDENYVEYELNLADIKFLVWYAMCMNYEPRRVVSPLNDEFLKVADVVFTLLDENYDEAPVPEGFNLQEEIDFHDNNDQEKIFHLANWLFMYSYLLTPANALTLTQNMQKLNDKDPEYMHNLQRMVNESMVEDPTGPLALYLQEWLYLVLENKTLSAKKDKGENEEHPLWKKFIKATNGERIAYFGDYQSMNRFFIDALGWHDGEEHLPQLKESEDFVLLVDQYKGLLVARNVAKCINSPANKYYNQSYAEQHAIDMLTIRGNCPCDLLRYIINKGWLTDAHFPGESDTAIVQGNADFIARCYLQLYYRD